MAASTFRHRVSTQVLAFGISIYILDSVVHLKELVWHEVEMVALSLTGLSQAFRKACIFNTALVLWDPQAFPLPRVHPQEPTVDIPCLQVSLHFLF